MRRGRDAKRLQQSRAPPLKLTTAGMSIRQARNELPEPFARVRNFNTEGQYAVTHPGDRATLVLVSIRNAELMAVGTVQTPYNLGGVTVAKGGK